MLGTLKTAQKDVEARQKLWLKLLDTAEKQLRARQSAAFDGRRARELKRALTAADTRKDDDASIRDLALEGLRQVADFIQQTHWLHHRFSDGCFADVPGLCKKVARADIAANDWSLTHGHYVGVAPAAEEDEDDFQTRLAEIHAEIDELNSHLKLAAPALPNDTLMRYCAEYLAKQKGSRAIDFVNARRVLR